MPSRRANGQVLVETALAAIGLVVLAFIIVRVGLWLNQGFVDRNASFQATRTAAGQPGAGVVPFAAPPPIHLIGPGADATGSAPAQGPGPSAVPAGCSSAGAAYLNQAAALRTEIESLAGTSKTQREDAVDYSNKAADLISANVSAGTPPAACRIASDPSFTNMSPCSGNQCKGANWYWLKGLQIACIEGKIADAQAAVAAAEAALAQAEADLAACEGGGGKGGGRFGEHRVIPGRARISLRFGEPGDAGHGQARHTGLDLSAPAGTPVLAFELGTVVATGDEPDGYGRYILLEHGDGRHSLYAHLRRMYVRDGERVEAGQFIGEVGSTGHSSGAHLHFELIEQGRPVDPEPHLRLPQAASWDGVVPARGGDSSGSSSGGDTGTKDDTGGKDEPDCSSQQDAVDDARDALENAQNELEKWENAKTALCNAAMTGNSWMPGPPVACNELGLKVYGQNIDAAASMNAALGKNLADTLDTNADQIEVRIQMAEELERQGRAECASGPD